MAEEGALSYESYLKVPELLSLQALQSDPPEHDELQFIVVHQTYELWFRLVLHELDAVSALLGDGLPRDAARLVDRCVRVVRVLTDQLDVLETMRPVDFLRFRDRLKPASGFQSVQFREIEIVLGFRDPGLLRFFPPGSAARPRLDARLGTPSLRDRFLALVDARLGAGGTEAGRAAALRRLYTDGPDRDLLDLAEALVELDERLAIWRYRHVRMAERAIGGGRTGTGGSEGVAYLAETVRRKERAFPELWAVRAEI